LYHARPSNVAIFHVKTFVAKPSTIKRQWYVIDATDRVLGRVATEVAHRLRGKHKAEFTPNIDTGDYVIVVNAGKIRVSGAKERDKFYYRYSGYQSGLKRLSVAQLRTRRPERIVEHAVRGMLPKNSLGREMFRKLKVYAGADHKHAAQEPKALAI
jgi:large subunit ribosomal protein L13